MGDELERLNQETIIGNSISEFLDMLPDLQPRNSAYGKRRNSSNDRIELSVRRGGEVPQDEALVCGEEMFWMYTRSNQIDVLHESDEEDAASASFPFKFNLWGSPIPDRL